MSLSSNFKNLFRPQVRHLQARFVSLRQIPEKMFINFKAKKKRKSKRNERLRVSFLNTKVEF